jgi:DNA-binding FadR family transcriptional regulator
VAAVKFDALKRPTAVEQVVERITRVIQERKLAAGQRLPGEHELVEQFQVSRPVLREALAKLQSLGLVEIQRGKGTFVGDTSSLANCVRLLQTAVTISPRELLTYTELRTGIEVQAVRQAAERVSEAEIAELGGLLKDLDREDLPYAELLEIDFRFHRKIIAIAGNPLMANLMEVIYEFVLTQMARTTPTPRENQLGRKLHRTIFNAVASHDADTAERAMREHMQAVLKRLKV